jgi:hypothetical protein
VNKRYQPQGAMPSNIEIFDHNREWTPIENLNRRLTQIKANREWTRMYTNK